MDQVLNTEMTIVPFVGATSTFMVAFWLFWRRQARRSSAAALLRLASLNETAVTKQVDQDMIVYDCLVCLSQVSAIDEYRRLPNCKHGVQFHGHCLDAWLKHNSTCPLCRSHIPRPLTQRLHTYLLQHLLQDVIIAYCNSVLDNVASSIGDCRDL